MVNVYTDIVHLNINTFNILSPTKIIIVTKTLRKCIFLINLYYYDVPIIQFKNIFIQAG